jgi:multidrug resistance protein MdtO
MASYDQTLPAIAPLKALDNAAAWFWQFLKNELTPYPGRAWVVARITLAATLTMIVVMTFRVPFGFLGAIYTIFLTRENPTLTFHAGVKTLVVYAIATVYTLLGIATLVADPLTHFVWITGSLLLAFYVIRILPDYFTAVGFGFTLAGAIPLWDETLLSVNQRTENTLWLGFSVVIGAAVTVVVEYVFRRVHPKNDLAEGLDARLQVVEDSLRQIATGIPASGEAEDKISLYASVGGSRLRRLLLRSGYAPDIIAKLNTVVALLTRLIDLTASLRILGSAHALAPSPSDRERILLLADRVAALRQDVHQQRVPRALELATDAQPTNMPLLPEMERTLALIPQAFARSPSGQGTTQAPPLQMAPREQLLVSDAFSNLEHLKFAVRGTLATMAAYVTYKVIDYPGLSTAVATCIITALSTIGSSRQKQFLRLAGAAIGGFVFGMGAQVFVLPHVDSITGFTVLFAVVTAIAAWIATASSRLSYLGVQLALAFFLINLQEFAFQTSLAVARDRVLGVLLGLLSMWLIFDRLWERDALQEMQDAFARNLRLLAELVEQASNDDVQAARKRVIELRDQTNNGFNTVRSQADAVLFEFGPSRRRKLKIREDFRRWQPSLGILLEVQVTSFQYQFRARSSEPSPLIVKAQSDFENALATMIRAMSDEVSGKPSGMVPDIVQSAAVVRHEIQNQYPAAIPPMLIDMITLDQNLASIVAPLYEDIKRTFADSQGAAMHHSKLWLGEARR